MLPLVVITVAIAALVLLVAWGKVHPFLAFILVSTGAALALGMPMADVPVAVRKGIGDILGSLAIVIVTGAMLGKIVVESGAAQRIADVLVNAFGERRMAWAMALTGFIVGIPLFYGVGFVLMVPIIFAVVERYRLPPLVVALPALAALSVAHGLLPAVLLLLTAVVGGVVPANSQAAAVVKFVSDPDVVMLTALAFASVTLGLARGRSLGAVMSTFAAAIGDVASILLVSGGSGAFKEVLIKSGVNTQIGAALQGLPLDPLVLAWLVTATIRACVGSATVAVLTAAGLLGPLVANGGADPNLMVLAIGAGSLALSHVNDAGFWLFKEYFNVSLADTLKTRTVMETIVSLVGLVGVLVLAKVI